MTLDDAGVGIVHHFVGGMYAKETHIPAGVKLLQHAHEFDHLSILVRGSALVEVDQSRHVYHAPAFITIAAGKLHQVTAITDVCWACLHATDETDLDKIDGAIVEGH